ncbi:MAG: hypothetical protein HDT39_06565 [Lachnospiraceae bacterium]|nr:hypothetical protein [Lachnospiraceae bacterium]
MRIKKQFFSILLVLCMFIIALPENTFAKSIKLENTVSTSGKGNAIKVKSISYELDKNGNPELEVDFISHVTWKKTAHISSITDNKGASYDGYFTDMDSDDCEICIPNLKEGRTYKIVINGIKKLGTESYRNLTLKVKVPSINSTSDKVKVKKVSVDMDNDDYDKYMTEIDIEFASKVNWKKSAKVTSVVDDKGKSYKGYLTEKDSDDCEVYIKNIKYGKIYTIKISGIKTRKASSYETITVKVTVPKQTHNLQVKQVEYDEDFDYGTPEYEVSFEFNKNVIHKNNSYIIIKDSNGKKYSSKNSYVEWDEDECEVILSHKLNVGKTYTYEIVNVKAYGEKTFSTLKGSFIAK